MADWGPWISSIPGRCWGFSCLCCHPLSTHLHLAGGQGQSSAMDTLTITVKLRCSPPVSAEAHGPFVGWAARLSLFAKAGSARSQASLSQGPRPCVSGSRLLTLPGPGPAERGPASDQPRGLVPAPSPLLSHLQSDEELNPAPRLARLSTQGHIMDS